MKTPLRVVYWGTYDLGKPRNRILLRGLRENHAVVYECHKDIWEGVEDKSQVKGIWPKFILFLRLIVAYPVLIYKYLKIPPHDLVFVGYLGLFDVLVISFFARLRGVPVVWDVFLSLYDTVVNDRKIFSPANPLSKMLYCFEWIAARSASALLLDTRTHGEYVRQLFHLKNKDIGSVFVGCEPECFNRKKVAGCSLRPLSTSDQLSVLFYGQFIPLHGIGTIIEAARLLKEKPVKWLIIGQGQEDAKIQAMLDECPLPAVTLIEWVQYEELIDWIRDADICLGIFGVSGKASRVIPNKLYQVITAGKPVVTIDSPAIRELFHHDMENVFLVPPGNPRKLADTIQSLLTTSGWTTVCYPQEILNRIQPKTIGKELLLFFSDVTRK